MKSPVALLACLLLVPILDHGPVACAAAAAPDTLRAPPPIVFAAFAGDATELEHTLYLVESIRTFAGGMRACPVRVYAPRELLEAESALTERLAAAGARTAASAAPEDALRFPFARKVFAAAQAENETTGAAEILAWMDEDTIVLAEPAEFLLPRGVSFGFRPVMHKLIGSAADAPPDEFWRRVYDRLAVPDSAAFSVVTPADSQVIRAYFNAGLLVVRPERGLLRRWAESFPVLYRDPETAAMCRQDRYRTLFLHQVALAGAVLSALDRSEMRELPPRYNFPLFFQEMFGAKREFNDLTGLATLRYDVYFRDPAPDWAERLHGPREQIGWLAERLGKR